MSKAAKKELRTAALSEAAGWMEILRLNKKRFEILSKKVNLKFDPEFHIADPVQRLIVTLRFLVTGEGYHDTLQTMFVRTFEKILEALEDKGPISISRYEAIAGDFHDKWSVSNCLGAVVMKRIPVEVVPEFRWMYLDRSDPEPYFQFHMFFDANSRVTSSHNGYPGVHGDIDTIPRLLESRENGLPSPRARPGTTKKLAYTYIGSDTLPAHARLRVPCSAQNDNEKQEIMRGLWPAEKAFRMIQTRFGILRATVPIPRFGFDINLNRVISSLHNFFMDNNPAYAAGLDSMMADLSVDEQMTLAPIKNSIPRYAVDVDREWMDKLHMDNETFQHLLKLMKPSFLQNTYTQARPDLRLKVVLSYMATSKGYEPFIEYLLNNTFLAFKESLQEYEKGLPFPEKKWLKIAADFDRKMGLQKCIGVIYPQVILISDSDPSADIVTGCRVLILDAFGRISVSGPIINIGKDFNIGDVVEGFLKVYEFGLPDVKTGIKKLMFIGDPRMKADSLLATPAQAGHFTETQIKRALILQQKVDMVLKDRFAFIGNDDTQIAPGCHIRGLKQKTGGLSDARLLGITYALEKLHNFLMDKSATYGDVFKDLYN